MRKKRQQFYFLMIGLWTILFGLGGCANSSSDQSSAWPSIGNIQIDPQMDSKQYKLLQGDFELLDSITPDADTSGKLQSTLKLKDVTPTSLRQWLESRVKFIARGTFDLTSNFRVASLSPFSIDPAGAYHPEMFPRFGVNTESNFSAANTGTNVYDYCFANHLACGLSLDGPGLVTVNSPRVGFVQVFDALFKSFPVSGDNPDLSSRDQSDIFYRIHRLAILFHEGRHSDGNKDSPGVPAGNPLIAKDSEDNVLRLGTRNFVHVMCPKGSGLENQYACDFNLNGPYSVQALIAQTLLNSCTTCTKATKDLVANYISDINARVITDGATHWDDTPETMNIPNQ